jgi:hypothetical protein
MESSVLVACNVPIILVRAMTAVQTEVSEWREIPVIEVSRLIHFSASELGRAACEYTRSIGDWSALET